MKPKIHLYGYLLLLVLCGCGNQHKYVIDADFLNNLPKFPTPHEAYMYWNKHHYELMYLLEKGDKDAVLISIRVASRMPDEQRIGLPDFLMLELYDHIEFNNLNDLSVDERVGMFIWYDKLRNNVGGWLADYEEYRDKYLKEHNDVSSAYELAKNKKNKDGANDKLKS